MVITYILIGVFCYIVGLVVQHRIEKKDISTKELISWQHGYNEGYDKAYQKGFDDAKLIFSQEKAKEKQVAETAIPSGWKCKSINKKTHANK